MNGGVSWAQFDCDVDEHVMFSRVAQLSCTRRKTRGSLSLICFVFPMFWLFRHAVRKQPLLIKKVQWSSFENRRGHDVMSTSFWFQRVPCVACFCCMPLASITRKLLCCRWSARLFNMVAHCVEGMFSV